MGKNQSLKAAPFSSQNPHTRTNGVMLSGARSAKSKDLRFSSPFSQNRG